MHVYIKQIMKDFNLTELKATTMFNRIRKTLDDMPDDEDDDDISN